MGQDSEEAAEFVVTVRNEHVKMKEWYTNSQAPSVVALKEKHGAYPQMWREVLNWPGWKETRKEYLKAEQQQEQQQPSNGGGDTAAAAANNNNTPAVPRKRKSRWGSATTKDNGNNNAPAAAATTDSNKRWAAAPTAPVPNSNNNAPRVVLPSVSAANPNLTLPQQQELRDLQSKLRAVNERLDNLEKEAARVDALPRGHRERSPSPPPMYGADGKRKNTRAVRWRERYTAERQDLLESIMRLSSKGGTGGPLGGLPAGASSLLVRKRVKKIRIPVEEHPTYNFIGLIIGPRGKTQKELEAKTGCKIAIRGRGSVKEGARGRRDGKVMDGDNEPLHVVISGDDQRAVDAASDMVEQMLVVIDDEKNVHKQQQLRELALLNGTLKEEDVYCQICAEKGHRSFECPKRFANKGGTGMGVVKCSICGDASHPTRDCPRKNMQTTTPGGGAPAAEGAGGNQQEMDSEYRSFMAELDGKKEAGNDKASDPSAGSGGNNNLPPPPEMKLPPPPQGGLPPPPPSGGAPQPPQAAAPAGNFSGGGPHDRPPQQQGSYGHYQPHRQPQQQQGHYGNGGGYNQQYNNQGRYGHGGQQGQYGLGYQQQQQQQPPQQQQQQQGGQQQQQQQQQPQQVKPGEETQGWDPSSYYSGGAGGGFNWWGS